MDLTLRALNRFGLGARPAERGRISDPRGWLRTQLGGAAPSITAPDIASPTAIAEALRAVRAAAQDQAKRQEARRRLVAIAVAESRACLTQRVSTDRPFVERLVAFWSNHLCVSAAAKVQVAPLAGSYEREVIRPHVLGRFEDLVLASARHPAMLIYLDNFQSIGPDSPGAKRARGARAQRGLNENYARELLELHTLGVDGGYAQQDVQELAKALTGWSVGGLNDGPDAAPMGRRRAAPSGATARGDEAMSFAYRPLLHEPGARTIVGKRYNDEGVGQGERIIRDLCRHPSTARFVATKLVTHFVSDTPPASAVDRVARVFRESEGDLRAVSGALIDLPEAWSPDARKFRTPQDWLVAVLRAFGQQEVGRARGRGAPPAAASAVVPGGPQGLRRFDAGMGRSRLAAESGRAGADASRGAARAARPNRARCSTWWTWHRRIRCGRFWPTPPSRPPNASPWPLPVPRFSGDSDEPPSLRPHDVSGWPRHLRQPARLVRAGAAARPARVRAAARRLRRPGRGGAAWRSRLRSAPRRACLRRPEPCAAGRHLRALTGPGAAPRAVAEGRARRAARHGHPVSHAQPLRRPGHSRDRHRQAGGFGGRMAEPPAAGDAGIALGHRHRRRHAALAERLVRRPDLVAREARRRGRCLPGAAGAALSRRQRAARTIRGGAAAAGHGRRRADGRQRRAAWRRSRR